MKKYRLKFISNIVLLLFLLSIFTYAASPIVIEKADSPVGLIDLDRNNNVSSNEISEKYEKKEAKESSLESNNITNKEDETIINSESSDEELEQILLDYVNSIEDAKKKAEYPEVYNLPTLLTQPEIHPNIDDFYGKGEDTVPICSVNVKNDNDKSNYIALTFDSAYINTYTYTILDKLDKYNFKCTFFMTHDFMKKNPEQVLEIISRGHEIGNHSTTHPDLNEKTDQEVVSEIWKTHCFFKHLTGLNMSLFRYPYGSYSPRTLKIVKLLGYYPIQWAVDSVDWKNISTGSIMRKLEREDAYKAGNIILFHNGATYTPECLDDILQIIVDNGLKVVRVSDLLYPHDFYLQGGEQRSNQTAIKE